MRFAIGLFGASPTQAGVLPAGPNIKVTDPALGDDDARSPDIAAQGNVRYAVWLDERFGSTLKEEVFFARSEDGGQTWGTNKDISLDGFDGKM